MGGFIAQAFLAQNPAFGAGMIGIDTCPLGEKYYSRSDRWWLKHVEGMLRLYPSALLRWAIARACARTAYARANMRAILAAYSKDELCRPDGLWVWRLFCELTAISRCRANVLLLVGAHDRTGKVRAYNNAWSQATGYPLMIVPDASHNANADNPTFVNAQIGSLCGQTGEQ